MVRARDGSLVRRVQRSGSGRVKSPVKTERRDAKAPVHVETRGTTDEMLRSIAVRADCPDTVRQAIEQSIGAGDAAAAEVSLECAATTLPRESAAETSRLTASHIIADTDALLEAVAAADAVTSDDERRLETTVSNADSSRSLPSESQSAVTISASENPQGHARPAARKATKRSKSSRGSVFSRLQPGVDPAILQRVRDDLEAEKKKQAEARKPSTNSAAVSSFIDRMSTIEYSSADSRNTSPSSRSGISQVDDDDKISSSCAASDPFIALMNVSQPAKDRKDSAVVKPRTVHTVLRSPFYEVTHNASLGLAGGRPGEGPKHVEETDIIQNGGRVLHACFPADQDPRSTTARMIRFADCGIFTADQLAHTLATRTTPGFQIPQSCIVRGRAVLLSELLITCCAGCTMMNPIETQPELIHLYQRLLDDSNSATMPRGAPLKNEPMPWVSPQLALALFAVQRLDLRDALVRIKVTTPQEFLQVADFERQAAQSNGEESILDLPINLKLRETGDRVLVTADIAKIRQQLLPSHNSKTSALDGCLLHGAEGVNWSAVPPLISKGVRRSLREIHEDAQFGDVCYIPGQIPLVIGLQTGSQHGGNADVSTWTNQGNARCPRVVQVLDSARGAIGLKAGTRIISEKGDARATLTRDASVDGSDLRYILDGSSRRDFVRNDWVFESIKYRWEKVRQVDDPIAFWRVACQPQLDDEADKLDEEQSIIALAEALTERFVDTLGGSPHIVLCRLDLDKVTCANPLSAATKGLKGKALLRARAAWLNYHALIEVAKLRMTSMGGSSQKKRSSRSDMRRGGCGLFVELHPMLPDAPGAHGPVQLGYGLVPYEVRSCVTGRQPAGSRIDSAAVTRAFNAFDRDGSGAIDRTEFSQAVSALDLDMTEEDITEVMDDIDTDGSGEIDKFEFKKWFAQGQDESGGGGKIAEIRARTMLANSLIGGLAKRLRHLPPSAALVGDTALGDLLGKYDLKAVPRSDNVMPFRVSDDYESGRYSVQAHRTPNVDAVEIALPPWVFRASVEQLKAKAEDAFATFDADGSGDIDVDELRLLAKKLRLKLDEKEAKAAVAAMTGDVESEVVTKEQFTRWYSMPSPANGSSGTETAPPGLSAADVAQRLHVRRSAARLADGLASFLTLNYGFTTLPGSGARRGPPRLMGSMFIRAIKVDEVKIKSDGTLVGGN